ncbi:MAG: hypothetical protein JW959_13905 [Pirellulales bacterium]|nr:hypothetical protein [Pirellulales bacterium]
MHRRPKYLLFAFAAAALLALPAESQAGRVWDCLFGNAPPSLTAYSPVFVPSSATPSYSSCESSCDPCAPIGSPCVVPQTCQYLPTVVYRPAYHPAAHGSYGVSTVTTYRPFLGAYQTRLAPYTTYRPLYVPTVYYQNYCAPSYCDPCASCGSAAGGAVGSSCPSCVPAAQAAPQTAPQTYKDEVKKPAVDRPLDPIPQSEGQLNSTPSPQLPDPNNRTAARYPTTSHVAPAPSERNDGGWYPVKQ